MVVMAPYIIRSAVLFLPRCIILLTSIETVLLLYLASGTTSRFAGFVRRGIDSAPSVHSKTGEKPSSRAPLAQREHYHKGIRLRVLVPGLPEEWRPQPAGRRLLRAFLPRSVLAPTPLATAYTLRIERAADN